MMYDCGIYSYIILCDLIILSFYYLKASCFLEQAMIYDCDIYSYIILRDLFILSYNYLKQAAT